MTRSNENSSDRAGVPITRRHWLASAAGSLALGLSGRQVAISGQRVDAATVDPKTLDAAKRELIRALLYTRADIDDWLALRAFPFAKYDRELGYLHRDRQFAEGLDGAICTYRYDANGARHTSAYADRPCRINTYGNSFTSCEQVSDGETWQEVLAAHLGEPIRNFGIGGYSVYQA